MYVCFLPNVHSFQMPGLLSVKRALPAFPNVWPYNTKRFSQAELSVKLQMCNKLVEKAKKSVFFVIALGPRQGEEVVCWQVRVANVQNHLRQHKIAQKMVEEEMYSEPAHLNSDNE